MIETTKVVVLPFKQVSVDHAYKEGEEDRSLAYWQNIHENFFSKWLHRDGLNFSQVSLVIIEGFRVVYPRDQKLPISWGFFTLREG
ncbi:ASCH domain-containing protein [Streptococcus vestibularis]|nr:ASCH domain-containing protein [Streptococcus vestibularis]MCB8587671.1 ASCH domain-containing protein [Streptococcus vestibularis]